MASLLPTILSLLLAISSAAAQPPSAIPTANADNSYYNASVSPALAILVIALICAFLLLGFFSIYLRRCASDSSAVAPGLIPGTRSRRGARTGLDPSSLEKFPTIVYSSVKQQRLGKERLECAVCLCEFEDEDVLRLLPGCSHVYHRDCVDEWFAAHVTCPVCRSNLAEEDRTVVEDLVRIGSLRREARAGSVKRVVAGDWEAAVAAAGGDGGERFRLRLPEDLRREILREGRLRRTASFAVFPAGSRRGWRFLRSFSARAPEGGDAV